MALAQKVAMSLSPPGLHPLPYLPSSSQLSLSLSADRRGTGYYKIGYFYTKRNSIKVKYVKAGAYIFLL